MTIETYRRREEKKESILVASGSMVCASGSSIITSTANTNRETKREVGPVYKLSRTLPTEAFPPQDYTILPNSAISWRASQLPEPMGTILIPTTTYIHSYMFI